MVEGDRFWVLKKNVKTYSRLDVLHENFIQKLVPKSRIYENFTMKYEVFYKMITSEDRNEKSLAIHYCLSFFSFSCTFYQVIHKNRVPLRNDNACPEDLKINFFFSVQFQV